ncbi:MAG: hypothetical protein IPP73_10260 [Chitinophagaceae bacterium]|nr:hypothetical protein [Chitinophagaceae bacterium]
MKKIIIAIVIIAIAATGSYFYFTNANFKNAANQFVKNNITGADKPPPVTKATQQSWVAVIADGTGSGYTQYSVPKVEQTYLNRMADSIHTNGGGRLWLSYIDNDSKNNQCLYLPIPGSILKETKPSIGSGETSFEADDKKKAWEKRVAGFSQDSANHEAAYQKAKEKFLNDCVLILTKKIYLPGSPQNQWSDVIGSLNSSFETFNAITDTLPAHKYVVAFSDLQHDAPQLKPAPKLNSIPKGLTLIAVNPAPGSSKNVPSR